MIVTHGNTIPLCWGCKLSKSKTRAKAKGPTPIVIKYEMFKAQKFLPYLGSGRYTYSKNHAALKQVYLGSGASMLFCGSSVSREWFVSFTTNAIDKDTGVLNKSPHFISMKIEGALMASKAVLIANTVWLDTVKAEMDAMGLLAISVDVVLRAKA